MSQSVDKLKELLFKPESDAIAQLSERIDAVFDRAGTTDRFQASVAKVLDGALRDAEVARHDEVASAIAPLIVRTVKTEIHNSTDDLVEALYPATGRMVKAYVASAIKDLTNEINRRLEANPVMLRLNALMSGRSAAELAIADSQRLKVEDIFLIRRATGELVARWPQGNGRTNLDHVMGGVLTAINEFTSEAFKSQGSALRQIDLGDSRVYLRVSPAYLLAAKCSGTAPIAAEQAIDAEFLNLIGRHHAALDSEPVSQGVAPKLSTLLQELSTRLETRLEHLQPSNGSLRRGVQPLTLLATFIGIPLAGFLLWNAYIDYRMSHVEAVARATVNATPQMTGYPNEAKASARGRIVTVSGLAPTQAVKSNLLAQLRLALPDVTINDQMNAVPVGSPDVRPLLNELKLDQRAFEAALKLAATKQSRERAARQVERASRLLLASTADASPQEKPKLVALANEAKELTLALGDTSELDAADGIAVRLKTLTTSINTLALTDLKLSNAITALRAEAETVAENPSESLAELAERAAGPSGIASSQDRDRDSRRFQASRRSGAPAMPHPGRNSARRRCERP